MSECSVQHNSEIQGSCAADAGQGWLSWIAIGTRQGIGVALLIASLAMLITGIWRAGFSWDGLPMAAWPFLLLGGLALTVCYRPCCFLYRQLCACDQLCGFLSSTVVARVLGALIIVIFGSWSVHGVLVKHTAFSQELSMQRDLQLEHYERKLEALGQFADTGAALIYHLAKYRSMELLLFSQDPTTPDEMKRLGIKYDIAVASYFKHQEEYVSIGSLDGLCLKIAGLYELENATAGAAGQREGHACFRKALDGFLSEGNERSVILGHINALEPPAEGSGAEAAAAAGTAFTLSPVEERFKAFALAWAAEADTESGCLQKGCFSGEGFPSASQSVVLRLRTLQVWADVMMDASSYASEDLLRTAEHRQDQLFDAIEALYQETLQSMSVALQEEQDSILRGS